MGPESNAERSVNPRVQKWLDAIHAEEAAMQREREVGSAGNHCAMPKPQQIGQVIFVGAQPEAPTETATET